MIETTGFDDRSIVRQVIELHDEVRHDPVALRLASIEFGSIGLWSAFRYELADLLYDHVWGRTTPESRSARAAGTLDDPGFVGRIRRNLRQGLWGPEFLSSILEPTGALDILEGTQFVWRSHRSTPAPPAPIALVGFAHRSGLMRFPPFVSHDEGDQGVSFQILLHDDNVSRQRRALRSVKHRLITAESFLHLSDYRRATQRAKEIEAILAPRETRVTRFAQVFDQFSARSVHRRRFRRLYLGAEALGRFMRGRAVETLVIPDERQPLARAAAIMAKTRSSAKVVSVSEPVDQFVRKMPFWGDVASDVVVVGGSAVQRALTRSGIDGEKFRTCRLPGLKSLLDTVATPPAACAGDEARLPTVLYCDQPLPGSSRRFTQLVDCLGNPPPARLIFRPHPSQSAALLRLFVNGGAIDRSQSIVEAIRSCDVVVTHSSMVATLVVLMERPVILWTSAPSPTMPVLLLENVAYWARTTGELAALITRLLGSRPDHSLRRNQVMYRSELASSWSAGELASVL